MSVVDVNECNHGRGLHGSALAGVAGRMRARLRTTCSRAEDLVISEKPIRSNGDSEMVLTVGCEYTRAEIHAHLGGSVVSCLPTRDGAIVAACLSKSFSPQAPEVVLCGKGARTSPVSAQFARQRMPIPVFLKSASSRWQYRGRFTVAQSFSSGARFEGFIAGSGRSVASVSHVVLLEQSV